MGRPGTSGGGGGSFGGHSSGRSSGGHRIGGGSRPGMSNTSSNRSYGSGGFHSYHGTRIYVGGRHTNSPIGGLVIVIFIVLGFLLSIGQGFADTGLL
jgi:hypothetical protein